MPIDLTLIDFVKVDHVKSWCRTHWPHANWFRASWSRGKTPLLQLDPWQLSLKYSNSVTELPSDLLVQLVRAWQAICQVTGSSPSLSHCLFSPSFSLTFLSHWFWYRLRSDCQVWSMLKSEPSCTSCFALATPTPRQDGRLLSSTLFSPIPQTPSQRSRRETSVSAAPS